MKECDIKSKEIRLVLNPNEIINMVPYIRSYILLVDNIQCDKRIKEKIQKIVSNNNMIEAIIQLFGKKLYIN